jgi:hypothetical protein
MDEIGDDPGKSKRFGDPPFPAAQAPNQAGDRFAMFPLWAASVPLTSTARRVYDAISGSANGSWGKERSVRLSLKMIAALTRIPRHKIPRAIKELETAGLLRKRPQKTEHGGRGTTLYVLIDKRGGGSSRRGNTQSPYEEQVFPHQVVPEKGTILREEKKRRFRSPKMENGNGASVDPVKKALFEAGLRLLVEHGGLPVDRARKILGRWRKLAGHENDVLLLGWIRDAMRNSIPDPVAYIEAVIKGQAKRSEFGAGYRPMPSAAGG